MRLYYPIISTLFLTLLLTSCEEPVDFELDKNARLVVTSHFSENKALVVYVSESKPVTSNKSTVYVENASISVFSGNEFIEIMEFVDNDSRPYYRTNELNPAVGEHYTIKVNVPGHDIVTATNSIPIPVPIEDVHFVPRVANGGENTTFVDFTVSVSIQDPVEYDNFYHIYFYQELVGYEVLPSGDTVSSTETTLDTEIDISLSDPDFNAEKNFFDNRSFLIDDKNFNGELVVIPFEGSYLFDPSRFKPGSFIVELRTVSREYYNYYSSALAQANAGGPLNDSSVLDDNIINGEGIFAGFSITTKNTDFQN